MTASGNVGVDLAHVCAPAPIRSLVPEDRPPSRRSPSTTWCRRSTGRLPRPGQFRRQHRRCGRAPSRSCRRRLARVRGSASAAECRGRRPVHVDSVPFGSEEDRVRSGVTSCGLFAQAVRSGARLQFVQFAGHPGPHRRTPVVRVSTDDSRRRATTKQQQHSRIGSANFLDWPATGARSPGFSTAPAGHRLAT